MSGGASVPLAVLGCVVAALQLGYSEPGLLYLAPALLLLLVLSLGRYPGERMLIRAARALRRGPGSANSEPRVRRIALLAFPRGGKLLAMSLAGRAPPV
jgi:hypothetical protein